MGSRTMWPTRCRHVIFIAPMLPENGGGGTFAEVMSDALQEIGVNVEHLSLEPGVRTARFPTSVVYRHPDLQGGPTLRGRRDPLRISEALRTFLVKRWDRRTALTALRRRFSSLDDRTAAVFIDGRPKAALNAAGYRRTDTGPLMIGMHHSNLSDFPRTAKAELFGTFDNLDAFIGLSQTDADEFKRATGVPSFHIPNPAPPLDVPTADRARVAVALTRLSGEKQLDVMIRAFVQATADLGGWRLDIYGSGPEYSMLAGLIDALEAHEKVRLMGRTDRIGEALSTARLNILTSRFEGQPMSILEAAVAGVPTLAFDVSPGVHELLRDQAGYLVPPGDQTALVEALTLALSDEKELARRGCRAMARTDEYAPEAIVSRWGAVIEACYANRDAPKGPR